MPETMTGQQFEEAALGLVEGGREEREKTLYLNYDEAVSQVLGRQLGDPTEPLPEFANDLHATIAERLGLEDYHNLEFYTAVGTALDYYHGTDGFFILHTDERDVWVTFDITLRRKNNFRVDSVIHVSDPNILELPHQNKKYLAVLDSLASSVVVSFRRQMEDAL